jgi:hypothetical protein
MSAESCSILIFIPLEFVVVQLFFLIFDFFLLFYGSIFQRPQTFHFRRKGWARTFFKGRKHFSSGAKVGREYFSKAANIFHQVQRLGANIFQGRKHFSSGAKVWRKHFRNPPISQKQIILGSA